MKLLSAAFNLALNALYVRIPNCVASSMRVAYVITEMYSLATNITLCHLDTSRLIPIFPAAKFHNIVIITDTLQKSK